METGVVTETPTNKFTILEDKVYRVVELPHKTLYQICVLTSLRHLLLHLYHTYPLVFHLGRFKTYKRLQSLVYWPKMSLDVKTNVQHSQVCQVLKLESHKPPGKLQQTVVNEPWEMIGVDLMGPFPRSAHGNLYLLVFIDYFTHWVVPST